jgi:hypothetical protein
MERWFSAITGRTAGFLDPVSLPPPSLSLSIYIYIYIYLSISLVQRYVQVRAISRARGRAGLFSRDMPQHA